ncbi:MAG: SDR family oxidoreductase [Deltaproteobacteria bacterium]|nr:SDR family oxidoreductase [Deltaproteobacteria bacterium]MBW2362659.1 SDR family oxidoreductase [Deltaproteobacteria bacterium]
MGVLDLSGKGALIVGAGKGIGRATALLLGAAGARTIVLDRHLDRGQGVADEIAAAGGDAAALCADLSTDGEVEGAVAEADRKADGLDIVVNITGSSSWAPLVSMDDETWDRDFRVNLKQQLSVGRNAARFWLERQRPGVVCVVASISGLFASSGHAAYGAAKAGLLSFVRSAAEEWWPHGIRVNAVVPGAVRTPRIADAFPEGDRARASEEMLARMAMPENVAGPIAFLVSDLATKVTGQTLVIDGGTTTRFPYRLT